MSQVRCDANVAADLFAKVCPSKGRELAIYPRSVDISPRIGQMQTRWSVGTRSSAGSAIYSGRTVSLLLFLFLTFLGADAAAQTATISVPGGGTLTYTVRNGSRAVRCGIDGMEIFPYSSFTSFSYSLATVQNPTAVAEYYPSSCSFQGGVVYVTNPNPLVLTLNDGCSLLVVAQLGGPSVTPSCTGFLKPKYQVVGVYYAPPGPKSTVTYGSGFNSGTSTMNASSFIFGETVSLTGSGPVQGKGANGTISTGWSQESDSSTSITLSKTQNLSNLIPGPSQSYLGVDHDFDYVAVWLNPEVEINVVGQKIMTQGYAYDPGDPAEMDVVWLSVGQLKGTQPIGVSNGVDLAYRLTRFWDPAGGPMTSADFAEILKADPFSTNPSYDPSADSNHRFDQPIGPNGPQDITVNYLPAPPGGQAICTMYNETYTATSMKGEGSIDIHTVSFTFDSGNIPLFNNYVNVDLKSVTTYSYTNKWSSTITNGTSQSASFNLCGPLSTDNYQGPTAMVVWKDNIYGTFMFFPEP